MLQLELNQWQLREWAGAAPAPVAKGGRGALHWGGSYMQAECVRRYMQDASEIRSLRQLAACPSPTPSANP